MPVDFSGNGYLATDAAVVVDAFERALEKLVVDRRDPEALVVAKHIITFAKAGERDPERLRDLTVKAVRNELRRAESFGASAGDQLSSGTDSVWNALPCRS
jgi:hypothetical protein